MKRMAILLFLTFLLGGCGANAGKETSAVPAATQPYVPETVFQETEAAETNTASMTQGQAEYSILENDDSIRNESGEIVLKICYDQVILDTGNPLWETINGQILADYQTFREETDILRGSGADEWEKHMETMGVVQGKLLSCCKAEVTNNSGGIFSIRMTKEEYLGAVFTTKHYGLTFDLTTGQPLALARFSDLPEEEFAEQLKGIVCDALAEDIDVLYQDPAEVLAGYSLEDFLFCIDDGELVLLFPTYNFGPGALGATVVKTGLYPVL